MRDRTLLWPLTAALALTLIAAPPASAQEETEADDGPPARVVAMTTFDIPFQDRAVVWPYLRDYYIPGLQLNPKVLNLRVMTHYYGPRAAEVSIVHEYASWADINEPCGQPCDDYREENPAPEEGSAGWAEYDAARKLFQKYYSNHRDEVYNVIRSVSKIEGRVVGTVGPPPTATPSPGGQPQR